MRGIYGSGSTFGGGSKGVGNSIFSPPARKHKTKSGKRKQKSNANKKDFNLGESFRGAGSNLGGPDLLEDEEPIEEEAVQLDIG